MLCLVPKQEEIIASLGDKVHKDGKASVITIQDLLTNKNGTIPRPGLKSPRFIAAVRAQRLSARQKSQNMSRSLSRASGRDNESLPYQPITLDHVPHPHRNLRYDCKRARSAVPASTRSLQSTRLSENVTSLSKQCCDVLGPHLCYECAKTLRREREAQRHEASLTDYDLSSENYATTVVVQRYIPNMSSDEVQEKLSTGNISGPMFKQWLVDMQMRAKEANEETRLAQKYTRHPLAIFRNMSSVQDVQVPGQVTKKKIFLGVPKDTVCNKKVPDTFSETIRPMFVSPRKVIHQKSRYTAYFEPPLLPKICQNVEPSFFAGSDKTYKLPERLPYDRVPEEAY